MPLLGFSDLPSNPFAPANPGVTITGPQGQALSGMDAFGTSGAAGALQSLVIGDPGIGGRSKSGSVFSDLPTNLPGLDLPGVDYGTASKLPDTSGTGNTLLGGVKETVSSGTLSRIAAGIIGILAIGAGLLMFRTTQTVITTAGKVAAKTAAMVV
jgi:hypothetical protein